MDDNTVIFLLSLSVLFLLYALLLAYVYTKDREDK
nr:MAG TPA: Potassium voltage-gated channel subfamily E, Membrane protein, Ion channel [Caudoviricetes sp.]